MVLKVVVLSTKSGHMSNSSSIAQMGTECFFMFVIKVALQIEH